MPYVHLLWNSSTMWLPFRKYGVRLWGRVRFWRGARVVTRMTPKTLYTRSNSLLMCFGVSFHEQCIVPLTSAFEDSVHQLQASGLAVLWRQFVLLQWLEILSTNRAEAASRLLPISKFIQNDCFATRNIVFVIVPVVNKKDNCGCSIGAWKLWKNIEHLGSADF